MRRVDPTPLTPNSFPHLNSPPKAQVASEPHSNEGFAGDNNLEPSTTLSHKVPVPTALNASPASAPTSPLAKSGTSSPFSLPSPTSWHKNTENMAKKLFSSFSKSPRMSPKRSPLDIEMRAPNEIAATGIPETKGMMIVLVNSRSGSGDGLRVLREIRALKDKDPLRTGKNVVLEIHGIDLSLGVESIVAELAKFLEHREEFEVFRLIAAGGDGTVKWVFDILFQEMGFTTETMPEVGILPLGTGNELGRCVGWGAGLQMRDFAKVIVSVAEGEEIKLDRWTMKFRNENGEEDEKGMIAFCSLGFDAKITNNFHNFRNQSPRATGTRSANKFWYFLFGMQEIFSTGFKIKDAVTVSVDGEPIELDDRAKNVLFCNIHSSADGTDFWGSTMPSTSSDLVDNDSGFKPALNDGILELCSTNGVMHMVTIKTGLLHSRRLAQTHGHRIEVVCRQPVPIQIDGEPWILPPSCITVRYAGQGSPSI